MSHHLDAQDRAQRSGLVTGLLVFAIVVVGGIMQRSAVAADFTCAVSDGIGEDGKYWWRVVVPTGPLSLESTQMWEGTCNARVDEQGSAAFITWLDAQPRIRDLESQVAELMVKLQQAENDVGELMAKLQQAENDVRAATALAETRLLSAQWSYELYQATVRENILLRERCEAP